MGLFRKSKEQWFEKGSEYFDEENYQEAVDCYLQSFDAEDPDPNILYNIGLCYNNVEDYDDAIDSFNLIIEIDPDYAEAYFGKGMALQSQGRARLAIKNLNKAFEIGLKSENEVNGYIFLGLANSQLNKTEEARENFDAALEIDDENILALTSKARILFSSQNYDEAKELIEETLEIDPENTDALDLLERIESEIDGPEEDLDDDNGEELESATDSEEVISSDQKEEKLRPTEDDTSKKPKKTFKRPQDKKKETGPKGFACVAGMIELKEILRKDVIQPLKNPEKYKKFNVTIPNGILLYGPPGCGKTFIVEKLAEEVGYHFMDVPPSKIGSKYIHETSDNIAKIFTEAKDNAPTILFFDEFEALVPKRESLGSEAQYKTEEINEFLKHLNNASNQGILVVGATNQPDLIDRAVLRAGRIDKIILVQPPDIEARKELFKSKLSKVPHSSTINFEKLAEKTENYSSSDITAIIETAGRMAGDQDLDEINDDLMMYVIDNSKPSISKSQIESFRAFSHLERK